MDPTNQGARASRGPKTRLPHHGDKILPRTLRGISASSCRGLPSALRLEYRLLGEQLPLKLGTRSALHALLPAFRASSSVAR